MKPDIYAFALAADLTRIRIALQILRGVTDERLLSKEERSEILKALAIADQRGLDIEVGDG